MRSRPDEPGYEQPILHIKNEILYLGLDVHAENIAVALASVNLSAVGVSTALRGLPPPDLPDTSPAPCPPLTQRKVGYHAELSKTLRDFRAQPA